MKKFNFFYENIPITRCQFEMNVPNDWEENLDEYGCYSNGYYKAIEIDNDNE